MFVFAIFAPPSGPLRSLESVALIRERVPGSFAAAITVIQPIFTEPHRELALTQNAVLLALAAFLDLITLIAAHFGFGGHTGTLMPAIAPGNIPLVTN
jgi:hypothetical protein